MKILVPLVLLFFTSRCLSQDVSLTKAETINYLERKFKEIDGESCFSGVFASPELKFENGKIILKHIQVYTINGNKDYGYSVEVFNPIHIKDFYIEYSGRSTQCLKVKLSLPAKCTMNSSVSECTEVDFYFAGSVDDRSNGEKIKKALLHLQSLLKAEDDPFGN